MNINKFKNLKLSKILSSLPAPSVKLTSTKLTSTKLTSMKLAKVSGVALASLLVVGAMTARVQADVGNPEVQAYASAMKMAANAQDIDKVSQLISDDAVISITRNNKSGSMDKDEYLKRLQDNWQSSSEYRYTITVDNVVSTGSKAKADITTTESFIKDGRTVKFVTKSRATLKEAQQASGSSAILLKSVSQVTIN